ncbi:two-component system, response regulator, stage 0 sporulation protein F [Alkalithermobacter thermoalcaliphilus JW-YL-7 = DSM 7308]|uniref:Stage 0 sporulation protein A homolog n=1 Tax=Alkalithermobacter thermoalcaliphilus JW-YL-7 = DSM 7308 TaxID=1121328 RepID=A0A150FSJ1_CLOPD|nr:response regulator receiver protein [[Clostridium] paradoxum JW-YL-7 = DSM 7308]SHK71054.1 two-component system, response regulator, stage 0 sporulation protein F [[Clostridium] paradoxum JW-YL-7 = DSM 7308]
MKKKIMIVDDEVGLRSLLKAIFESDYDIYLCESGKTAIDTIKDENIDIVFLDMRLKDMDGLEILKNIRNINKTVKVIILTAFTDPKKVDRLYELNIEDIVQKPFDIFELKNKVDKIL